MEKISNSVLVKAIEHMQSLSEFKKFIKNCEKRLSRFDARKSFNYDSKDSNGNTCKVTYDFSQNKPMTEYVSILNSSIEKIICCDSIELTEWKKKFDAIKFDNIGPEILQGFFSKIQSILQYKTLRSGEDNLIFHFYKKLDVKVCVYCNSQHVILLNTSKLARLQADHNLPKAKYPCFSITLANLYPSCNNCNHLKKEDDIQYNLYYVTKPTREISFALNPIDISNFYLNNLEDEGLNIIFNQGSTKLDDVLKINEIYKNHVDYAADLLRKHRIYTESYISKLVVSFKDLLGNKEEQVERMIFGTTLSESNINQRVFSKLTIDLKKQLDALKSLN